MIYRYVPNLTKAAYLSKTTSSLYEFYFSRSGEEEEVQILDRPKSRRHISFGNKGGGTINDGQAEEEVELVKMVKDHDDPLILTPRRRTFEVKTKEGKEREKMSYKPLNIMQKFKVIINYLAFFY